MTYDITADFTEHLSLLFLPFVHSVWYEEERSYRNGGADDPGQETIVADPAVQLIVNLNQGPIEWSYDGESWYSQERGGVVFLSTARDLFHFW